MQATYSQIWKIAYPIILGSLAQTLISVTDTAFMGRVGEVQLAAIGLVSIYYLILFMIGYSYTKGTQILVARRSGEQKPKEIGRIFDNSLVVIFGLSIVIFIFLKYFSGFTLELMIFDEDVRASSWEYLNMRSYGVFMGFAGSVVLAFYMGIGSMPIILVSILSMSTINIALNYVLIFGHLGFPEMGMRGAALASNLAEVAAGLIFLFHIFWKKLYIQYRLFQLKKLSLGIIRKISKLSTPIVLQTLVGLSAWMIFFTYVEKMGSHEMAISSIVKSLYVIYGIPSWGFTAATNTIISNMLGQGKQLEVSKGIKRIIIMSFIFTSFLTMSMAAFPELLMGIYTSDSQVIEDGLPVIHVTILALWSYSISTILYHSIVSIGSTKISLAIQVAAVVLYLIFLQYVFSMESKTLSLVWTTEIFYWSVIAIMALIYLKSGHWKRIRI